MKNIEKKYLLALALAIIPTTFTSITASASNPCEINLQFSRGPGSHWTPKKRLKIARMFEKKGYVITDNEDTDYQARVSLSYGFTCGFGVTQNEFRFHLPASYSIEMTGPGIHLKKEEQFKGIAPIVGAMSFTKLKAEIRDVPECNQ